VQRVRLRFAKRGRLRFTSHRDVQRAVRRAGVPIAWSAGFSPHPRLSWAGAVPTGAASEAEYVEVGLAEAVDPEVLRAA
jgi:radical SAM-linked protein